MSVIDEFLGRYTREFDFFREASRLCAQRCETRLDQNGVRAIVSYRAKRPDRLKRKIESRNEKNDYKRVEDIYDNLADLAGVRIALYFPEDLDEVQKIINSRFVVLKQKEFPEGPESRNYGEYETQFPGYKARHYHVRLAADDLAEEERRYAQARIEIQVASVLVHAWAEVEHDLVYKPLSGNLSEEEYAILDELNGLVLTGEIALGRLQRATRQRVSERGSRFNNHYELAAYVYERFIERFRRTRDG
jgi:ppGpp synthetase/RelA/SpoT-type nucleotidyltranferase